MTLLPAALRITIGLVFLTGALLKLPRAKRLQSAIVAYRLIPSGWAAFISYVIVGLEASVGVCLIAKFVVEVALIAALVLLAIFSVAVGVALLRGVRDTECGCFTFGNQQLGWHVITRNVVLAGLAIPLVAPQLLGTSLLGTGMVLLLLATHKEGNNPATKGSVLVESGGAKCSPCEKEGRET